MNAEYILLVRLASAIEYAVCILPFAASFLPKKRMAARFLAGFFLYVCMTSMTIGLALHFTGISISILIILLLLSGGGIWMYLCWQIPVADFALCLCAGVATQALVGRLSEVFYLLAGDDPYHGIGDLFGIHFSTGAAWAIYGFLHLFLALGIVLVFRGRPSASRSRHYSLVGILYSVVVGISTIVLQVYSRPLEADQPRLAVVIRLLVILWSVMILVCRLMLISQGNISEELRITQLLLHAQQKEYESIKDDMQMINIKCHDIRHQLDQYAGRLTSSELSELRHMIQIYDSHLNTGNEILNMVLYKKQAIMEQKHIRFTCLSDARGMGFMDASDVFSLMNNAMDNAIEAVSHLEESLRLISLQIREENGILYIHLSNFTQNQIEGTSLPGTTKENRRLHGYGLLSIRFVVEKYGGVMSVRTEDGLFHLNICLPLHEDEEEVAV